MFILIVLGLILLITLILFSFPQFSPIPYFPSNKQDLPKILKTLDIDNDQVLIDLGAGDGMIIIEAAKEAYEKKLNTKFVAIDINPVLVFIMHLRRLLHPNRKNITIMRADMFTVDLSVIARSDNDKAISLFPHTHTMRSPLPPKRDRDDKKLNKEKNTTFYVYISPRFLEPMAERIAKLKGKKKIISYFYAIPSLKNKERIIDGKNKIYCYEST